MSAIFAGVALAAFSLPAAAKTLPASAGCEALQRGFFTYQPVPPLPGGPDTRTETLEFRAGETITFDWGGIGGLTVQFNGANVISASGTPSGSDSFDVAATGTASLFKRVVRGSSTGFVIVTCAAAIDNTPDDPDDPDDPDGPGGATGASIARTVDGALSDQAAEEPRRGLDGIDIFMALLTNTTPQGYDRFIQPEMLGLLWHLNYAPTLSLNPAASATADAFDFSAGPASGALALDSGEAEWSFNVLTNATRIDRASGGASRATLGGTTTFLAGRRLDGDTVLGFGLKLGAATTSGAGPAMTLNSLQVGADLVVARQLSQDLFGGVYLGYEIGGHRATIGGATGNFMSHTLKAGGKLTGRVVLDQFTLTPAVSAMLSYRHRNAYVDSASVAVPASNFFALNGNGGVTASRDFVLAERQMVVSPFVGGNILVDYATGDLAPALPLDIVRAQMGAGVGLTWMGGATASIQGSLSRGATTASYGLSASLHVPIN